jgi:sugar fermentation stimulation protein A
VKTPIFEIKTDLEATFIERQNKFLATVSIEGNNALAHIHDPGRLEGILEKGRTVLLTVFENPLRKTRYEIVGAKVDKEIVLVNSRYHNDIAEALIKMGVVKFGGSYLQIKREVKFENSRFDFMVEDKEKYLIEVKGCVLVKNGVALFPDSPTKRGARHMLELAQSINFGFKPIVFILIFRNAFEFKPNGEIDKEFEKNFYNALLQGVEAKKFVLSYDGRYVYFEKEIP